MTAVELRGITVRFGPVVANREVSLDARAGEVHAIVGENGAGKSTLMRALYGMVPLAAGEVLVRDERIARPSPSEAIRRGVGMVHQHFMLVDTLTVAENVVLGQETAGRLPGLLDGARAAAEVDALARRHGLAIDARRMVGELSVGEQQRVEILKALYRGARVLILDEPTAVLTPPEVADLFRVLRALRDGGGTVLIVTHKLDEVMAIADRVTVLRRGEVTARFSMTDREAVTPQAIARAMVGRDLQGAARSDGPGGAGPGDVRLELRDLDVPGRGGLAIAGVSLAVRAGEILGVAGVEGNGQSELLAAVMGLARPARGAVLLDGAEVTRASAGERRRRGIGYVPEDRHRQGLLLDLSIADNLLLGREADYARLGGLSIDRVRLRRDALALLAEYDVRPADPSAPVRALSGGNQQKVVIARELARRPRVIVAAQPTRGVDIGAIERIHRALDGARRAGAAILLVSAELDELLALSDRIAVLLRGRVVATLDRAEAQAARLGALMTGAAA